MAKRNSGTKKASGSKSRGRTSITESIVGRGPGKDMGPNPKKPNVPEEMRAEANRPVTAGGGKHRGDRRDMSKTYSGNQKHAARGNTPRADVKTRIR
jgi:hypothetical protein